MRHVLRVLDDIAEWSGKIISPLLALIILILSYEIVMRYAFNAPTQWVHEMSQLLFTGYALMCGAYTFRKGLHVNMDIFHGRLPKRIRAVVDLFTSFLALGFIFALLWFGGIDAWESILSREISMTNWGPPVYPAKMAVPIGAALIFLQWLAKFIRDLATALNLEVGE